MSVAEAPATSVFVRSKRSVAFWIAATALAPLVVYAVLSTVYISAWFVYTRHHGAPPPQLILESILIMLPPSEWAVVLGWWLIQRRRTGFVDLYGLRSASPAIDVAVGLALGAAWVGMYGLGDVVAWADMFRLNLAKLSSLPMSGTAGFCEEFLFRGFLFAIIAQAGGGWKSKLLWSSVAFSLLHVLWGPWGMAWTFILGATFGVVTLWRRNVWPAVIAHTVLNLCIEPGLFVKELTGGFGS
jgi:membrane protease YdiL (CAAX protease family)